MVKMMVQVMVVAQMVMVLVSLDAQVDRQIVGSGHFGLIVWTLNSDLLARRNFCRL